MMKTEEAVEAGDDAGDHNQELVVAADGGQDHNQKEDDIEVTGHLFGKVHARGDKEDIHENDPIACHGARKDPGGKKGQDNVGDEIDENEQMDSGDVGHPPLTEEDQVGGDDDGSPSKAENDFLSVLLSHGIPRA
jgi:hypothetical protein